MKHQMSYSIRPKKIGDDKEIQGKQEKKTQIIVHEKPLLYNEEPPNIYTVDFQRPRKPRHVLKTMVVIGGGITVGLLFGYALLNTFVHHPTPTSVPASKASSSIVQPSNAKTVVNPSKDISYQFTAINLFMVQGGVFTTKDSADKRVSELKSKKYAAEVMQEDGKYVVYLGVASSKENGSSLVQFFRSSNQQVILKEKQLSARTVTLHIPSSTNEQTVGLASQLDATGTDLIHMLTTITDEGLKNGKSSTVTEGNITSLHQKLLEQGASLSGMLPGDGKDNLQKSLNELAGAVNAARQFLKDPNQGYLFQLQGSLIRYYEKEKGLRSGNFS